MAQSLLQEFESQAVNPPGQDERIAAFSQAVLHCSATTEGTDMLSAVEARRFATASYGANLLLRAVQKQLVRTDASYPYEYDDPEAWSEAFMSLHASADRAAELYRDIADKHTQSNVVERYKACKLTMELLSPWLAATPRLLDVGCSRNHGLKKLHLQLPFKTVQSGIPLTEGILSPVLADRLANRLIASPLALGPSLGMDLTELDSAENAEWARSCSFYPKELLDKKAVAEYDFLDNAEPGSVTFKQGNILDHAEGGDETFDVAIVSTFMYQLTPVERNLARTALRHYVGDKGFIIYQDFTKRDRDGLDLQYEDSWFKSLYSYRTLVEAPAHTGERIFEVLRWANGRCDQWIPGRDLEALIKISDIA